MSWKLYANYKDSTFRRYYEGAYFMVMGDVFKILTKNQGHIVAVDKNSSKWVFETADFINRTDFVWPGDDIFTHCRTVITVGWKTKSGVVRRPSIPQHFKFGLNEWCSFGEDEEINFSLAAAILSTEPSRSWQDVGSAYREVVDYEGNINAAVSQSFCVRSEDGSLRFRHNGVVDIGRVSDEYCITLKPNYQQFEPAIKRELPDVEVIHE